MITPIMTLRQYYAAHAPFDLEDAFAAIPKKGRSIDGPELYAKLAEMRFAYADALLEAEREKSRQDLKIKSLLDAIRRGAVGNPVLSAFVDELSDTVRA